jgi:hypothetical protein
MLALFIVFFNRGTRTRIRTEISQLSVATEYKPAVLPLNYPGDVFVIAPLMECLIVFTVYYRMEYVSTVLYVIIDFFEQFSYDWMSCVKVVGT